MGKILEFKVKSVEPEAELETVVDPESKAVISSLKDLFTAQELDDLRAELDAVGEDEINE